MITPAVLSLLVSCCAADKAGAAQPVLLGVDDGGSYHYFVHQRLPWEVPAFFRALDEIGARFVSVHFWPVTNRGDANAAETARRLETLDDAMRARALKYSLNVELSNWLPKLEITPGINEFEHPGGAHRWDLRMDWLAPLLPPARAGDPALVAVTYDECEHMLLSGNKFSNAPQNSFDKPFLVNTHGVPLEIAYERLVAEATRIRREHYRDRIRLQTEQVWPDLFHLFARAGWTVTPKLLKENISPVVLSIALGAAIQYEDAGSAFWASPDLWNRGAYPGHSPEALRSALLMGYWLGAETLYVENFDYHEWAKRHPQADPKGSLVAWSDPDTLEVTAHGRVVRDFFKKYVPANPRTINWTDYDPRVAIIRLPDGGWGQYPTGEGRGEVESRNRLLGNREMPLDEPASEWLHAWPILTHGAVRAGSISYNNPFVYPRGVEKFFAPIDSVAVFDHLVGKRHLERIECLVVCGHALSAATFKAVRERVAEGATGIIARRLYTAYAQGELPGDWLIVDDFKDPAIAKKLARFLGPPDVARFRFRNRVVEFRKSGVPDGIEVRVVDRTEQN